ncbi:MAG: class I SAM-dependent methyltransferase [Fidelibacterota bacterium]
MKKEVYTFSDFLDHPENAVPAREIPWSDPDFSRRILKDQLNPEHDIGGRRPAAVERLAHFIHHHLLGGIPTTVLDLGCGPGLYSHILAETGNRCTGLDIAPAAIEYAQNIARAKSLPCTFVQRDYLSGDFGGNFGLIMLTFGDFNGFNPQTARELTTKIFTSLRPGGLFLLEALTADGVGNIGERESGWTVLPGGMFSDEAYLLLDQYHYDDNQKRSTADYYVILKSGVVEHFHQQYTGYSDDEYQQLLLAAGFDSVEFYPGFDSGGHDFADDLQLIVARK